MGIDLTLFLLKQEIVDLDHAIPLQKRDGLRRVRIHPDADLGEFACWIKRNAVRYPDWVAWLEDGFDFATEKPQVQSAGCVVLFRTAARIWAACFGTGWHAITTEVCERDFGLTVALNQVDPKRLRTLVTKTVDVKTRQRDTHKVAGGEANEFDLDFDLEWLRSAAGRTSRVDCGVMAGADSLKLRGWKRPLTDLTEAAAEFLELYERGLPEVFAFAENIKPILESDPLHAKLEADLQAAAQLRYQEILSLGIDAHLAFDTNAILSYGRKWNYKLEGVDDTALREALEDLAQVDSHFELRRVRLKLSDLDESEVLLSGPLIDYLQMQIDRDGDMYVRVEKRWFRCRGEYIRRLDERIAGIQDLTSALALPPWDKSVHPREEDYNLFVADQRQWLLQDQVFFYSSGQKLEPCDILTPFKQFVHTKDGSSSTALSHLFGQASAAADLLRHHQPFYAEIKRRFEDRWPDREYEKSGRATVVLGIARTPGDGGVLGHMLISKLNLLEHVRRIHARGYDVGLCRIDLSGAGGAQTTPTN